MPLDTSAALICDLLPKIESTQVTNEQVYDLLRNVSITEILPPAHPVVIRKFEWREPLVIWFRSMLWGQAYISSVSNYGPWNNTHVKLFHIKQQQQQSQQLENGNAASATPPRASLVTRVSSSNNNSGNNNISA